jgi:hypothetical protein
VKFIRDALLNDIIILITSHQQLELNDFNVTKAYIIQDKKLVSI